MPLRLRSFWYALAALLYVCVASLQALSDASQSARLALAALVGLPLVLFVTWRRTAMPREARDDVDVAVRSAARACVWGASVWIAARTAPSGLAGFDALANIGTGTCAVAGAVALARIRPLGGLLKPHPHTKSLDAAAFVGLLWAVSVALPGARAVFQENVFLLDPLAIDYATNAASLGSLLVLIAAIWRLRVLRRLEIGVSDRVAGALALTCTALLVVVPAAFLEIAPPDRVLPVGVLFASIASVGTVIVNEPTRVTSALRGILAVMILGTPVTLAIGALAKGSVSAAGPIALVGCVLSIGVGLLARAVARPLGPEQSRWLLALDKASRGALQPEPDAALRAALAALQAVYKDPGARPQLWRHDPPEVLKVDVAGYLHVEQGKAPEQIFELALAEPERTLRADVLQALQVRQPEVRPLLAWFELHGAFSSTLIVDEDGFTGVLMLPRGGRTSLMTLEEARAIRILADRISALLAVSSALARSRQRELKTNRRNEVLSDLMDSLKEQLSGAESRNVAFAERVAKPVTRSSFSGAAQVAVQQLRLATDEATLALYVPVGVDAAAWTARGHLLGPNRTGPLVLVDANHLGQYAADYWADDPSSPIRLAFGGSLVVLHLQVAPAEFQEGLARALVNQYAFDPELEQVLPPLRVLATFDEPFAVAAAHGRLASPLARWFRRSLRLPTLAERGEDVRPLIFEILVATGVRVAGEPLGIEPHALKALLDYEWPGNEAELGAVIARATAAARRRDEHASRVLLSDLESIGFAVDRESLFPVLRAVGSNAGPMPRGEVAKDSADSTSSGRPTAGGALSASIKREAAAPRRSEPPTSGSPTGRPRRRRPRAPRRRR